MQKQKQKQKQNKNENSRTNRLFLFFSSFEFMQIALQWAKIWQLFGVQHN